MVIHPYPHATDRFECTNRPHRCFMSASADVLFESVIKALEEEELPALEAKARNGDGDSVKIQQRIIQNLEQKLEGLKDQEEKQYELLETGKYTQELFDRRNSALREKMEDLTNQIRTAKAKIPKSVNYEERSITLKQAIAALRTDDMTVPQKNKLLRTIIDRIEFTGATPLTAPGSRKGRKKGLETFELEIFLRI